MLSFFTSGRSSPVALFLWGTTHGDAIAQGRPSLLFTVDWDGTSRTTHGAGRNAAGVARSFSLVGSTGIPAGSFRCRLGLCRRAAIRRIP